VPILLLTSVPDSALGEAVDVVLSTGPVEEASRIALVPTTSTVAQLALGDALAVVVLEERGFREEDFAFLHPGGVIGRKIGKRVRDLMHQGDALPIVHADVDVRAALGEIVAKRVGMTTIVDTSGRLQGVLTDGDLKRILLAHGHVLDRKVVDVMTRTPRTIDADASAVAAVARMENNPGGSITSLVVIDDEGRPMGVVHLHDCLRP
jgi:arabinose-5-phosphate isomerase